MANSLYDKPSLSGYNANAPADDGTKVASNEVTWSKHKTKLGDPLKTYTDAINNATESALDDIVAPPTASDSGTDTFQANLNRNVGEGEKVWVDFNSANTTTTPTLSNTGGTPGALTVTTRDGSALWPGALSGVHTFQLNAGATAWLVLDPNPIDEDDMASDSAAAVPTQQSVKAYALTGPGTSSDPALAFDTWRTPNANADTFVVLHVKTQTNGTTDGQIRIEADESGGTIADYILPHTVAAAQSSGSVEERGFLCTWIPAGGSYQIQNTSDPDVANGIQDHREFTFS